MLNIRGIKARPRDIEDMMRHQPALVEMHCSLQDLDWEPPRAYSAPLAVHLPEYDGGRLLDPASLKEVERQKVADIYARAVGRAIAWASFFGNYREKPKVVFHPGGNAIVECPEQIEAMTAALGKTVAQMKEAAGDKAEILIENMPKSPWFFGGTWRANMMLTGKDVASFCSKHDIGCTLDLCHLYLASQELALDMDEEIEAMLPHVRHVHYSDAKGVDQEGLQIGEGEYKDLAHHMLVLSGGDQRICAVPEIWFGHEKAGAGFSAAWSLLGKQLKESKQVLAE